MNLETIKEALGRGRLVPYLGPEMLWLSPDKTPPASAEALVAFLTRKVTPPGRIKDNLWAVAQFIESRKHRKTLVAFLEEAFAEENEPSPLHQFLASLPLPLVVNLWYDDTMARALAKSGRDWGQVQGVSQALQSAGWTRFFDAEGKRLPEDEVRDFETLLYCPLGSTRPEGNFLISDADFVEVLTEIDIQTPIPRLVQERRAQNGFLFLGMRFFDQTQRIFARQIMKRSAGPHFAVMEGHLGKNEGRFLEDQKIMRLDLPLAEFAAAVAGVKVS